MPLISRASWKSRWLGLALTATAAAQPLMAGTVTSTGTPVGFVNLPTLASSDALISPCFTRPSAYSGSVGSVSGAVITAAANPAWAVNAWVRSLPGQPESYYVQFKSGSANGRFYTVVSNTAQTVTVDWNGETPAAAANDKFVIIPYWTLGTLYPATEAGTGFTASSSESNRGTEILLPRPAATGINLAANGTYYFLSGAWRKSGESVSTSYDGTVVPPDSYLIQRNKTSATTVSIYGRVPTGIVSAVLSAQGGTVRQDNAVALAFPVPVTLNGSNLQGSGAFRASTSPLLHTDELYVFDNTATGVKKAASAIYYYYNSAWRKVGAPVTSDFGATAVFVPGTGVMVRKSGTGSTAATAYWTYTSPINP
ncbi:MAG: TIGR02597 family protein [Verrucomicrobia bacterium]|nr:TIGR02597 family protein [Verrucomicrobiota bacterium]